MSYQPVRDETGEVLGVCVSIADISALKQKEAALRESEQHYRFAAELNPQFPWSMNPDGTNITSSSRWESLTGTPPRQGSDDNFLEAIHPEDHPVCLSVMKANLVSGEPIDIEFRVRHKDGNWVWMRSRGAPRRDDAGKIVCWYGSMEDIDDHKRDMDALRCSEARLRAIIAAVPLGIVLADSATGNILISNAKADDLLGFELGSEMAGSETPGIVSDPSGCLIDRLDLPLMRALRHGSKTKGQRVLARRQDGSEIQLRLTAVPICLEDGDRRGGVLVIEQIQGEAPKSTEVLDLPDQPWLDFGLNG